MTGDVEELYGIRASKGHFHCKTYQLTNRELVSSSYGGMVSCLKHKYRVIGTVLGVCRLYLKIVDYARIIQQALVFFPALFPGSFRIGLDLGNYGLVQ